MAKPGVAGGRASFTSLFPNGPYYLQSPKKEMSDDSFTVMKKMGYVIVIWTSVKKQAAKDGWKKVEQRIGPEDAIAFAKEYAEENNLAYIQKV